MTNDVLAPESVDPDHVEQKQRDLETAHKIVVGDAPKMERPHDGRVSLVYGLSHNGEFLHDAEVRELTGKDEEALAKFTDMIELVDAIITRATVRIGSIDFTDMPVSERQTYLGNLLVGDRELLFLGVIAATYGNERDVPYTCPHCESNNEVTILIDEDFSPKEVDDLREFYEYVTSRGETVVYRLSNGFDALAVSRKKGLSLPQMNSLFLSHCILSVNGEPPLSPMEFVLNMGMKDRRAILEQMSNKQPTVDMNLKLKCPSCNEDVTLVVNWEDVFQF